MSRTRAPTPESRGGKESGCPPPLLACVEYFPMLCHVPIPPAERPRLFAGVNLAGLPGPGEAQGVSTHRGHFPYVSYLKVINQANKPLNEICSVFLPY